MRWFFDQDALQENQIIEEKVENLHGKVRQSIREQYLQQKPDPLRNWIFYKTVAT